MQFACGHVTIQQGCRPMWMLNTTENYIMFIDLKDCTDFENTFVLHKRV